MAVLLNLAWACNILPMGNGKWLRPTMVQAVLRSIDPIHKSQNAPDPYPIMVHSEQKRAHFCSEWSIVGYGTGAFWDSWDHDDRSPLCYTGLGTKPLPNSKLTQIFHTIKSKGLDLIIGSIRIYQHISFLTEKRNMIGFSTIYFLLETGHKKMNNKSRWYCQQQWL